MNLDQKLAEEALGNLAHQLWSDEHFAWKQLKSENWKARYVGLRALIAVWNLEEEEIVQLSRTLIENDPHDQVIIAALVAIGDIFSGRCIGEKNSYLAKICLDEKHSDQVRVSAYKSLCKINETSTEYFDSESADSVMYRLDQLKALFKDTMKPWSLNSIDWQHVRQFIE